MNVKIIKQNDKEIEFTKDITLQSEPKVKSELEIDGKPYIVRSIKQNEKQLIITVRDKSFKSRRFWD